MPYDERDVYTNLWDTVSKGIPAKREPQVDVRLGEAQIEPRWEIDVGRPQIEEPRYDVELGQAQIEEPRPRSLLAGRASAPKEQPAAKHWFPDERQSAELDTVLTSTPLPAPTRVSGERSAPQELPKGEAMYDIPGVGVARHGPTTQTTDSDQVLRQVTPPRPSSVGIPQEEMDSKEWERVNNIMAQLTSDPNVSDQDLYNIYDVLTEGMGPAPQGTHLDEGSVRALGALEASGRFSEQDLAAIGEVLLQANKAK
jgi:hypothetical protein